MTTRTLDVCVVGAGPAGSVVAARAAQLGFRVGIVERARFPRRHLGESLTAGVLPMLASFGAGGVVRAAGGVPVRRVLTTWDGARTEREDGREAGVLVDRAAFDSGLLRYAMACGVHCWQPAVVGTRTANADGWTLRIDAPEGAHTVHTRFLVDATGRSATLPGARRRIGRRTMALYAYWRGARLPSRPRIEAGRDAWYWGVPLPDGCYNTLAFVDGDALRERLRDIGLASHVQSTVPSPGNAALTACFHDLLSRSDLMEECDGAKLMGAVRAADATPYVDDASVSATSLKVGDAALSSSGVQKAVQTALAGAIVLNTLLRKPERGEDAAAFYRELLGSASATHASWAAGHYASVASRMPNAFWTDRAQGASHLEPTSAAPSAAPRDARREMVARMASDRLVSRSTDLALAELPLLGAAYVERGLAIRHPALETPVAFVGGVEIGPLLRDLPADHTPMQLARSWTPRVPLETGIALTAWLLEHGILVDAPAPVPTGAGGRR
jgi:hypothetical protein